jgi:transcriptional regulator NrdR family protein
MVNKIQADCPKCGQGRTRVVCTKRALDGVTIRRRRCVVCEHRWYSIQYPEVPVSDQEIKWIGSGSNARFKQSA